ncbi:Kelch repeat-containing protein [Formosa haliotis]|uniref:Kelch repeat-containing protein n=1 Tax=Formosa haliotis TaxID=1555194 RepID=UPI0008254844|nr:kelch repeat-containing protein [Formosa haliotis]
MKQKNVLFYFILALLGILFTGASYGQDLEHAVWQELSCTGEPVKRHEAAFVEADGKFYLAGGRRIQEVSIFNPETNTWTSGAKPPVEIHHFEGVAYKGDILAVGAHTGKYIHETPLEAVYAYSPKTDTWSSPFKMPKNRARGSSTATIYKDKLYIVGGILDGHWDGHVAWTDCYDFKTKTWRTLADAPRARDHATSVVCNDKLYVIGGRRSSGKIKKVMDLTVSEIDVFDLKTETWSTLKTKLPTERAGLTALTLGDEIIVTGGESATQKAAYSTVDCLDTKTGTWRSWPDLDQGRHGTQLIQYKGRLYIASGCAERGGSTELKTLSVLSE